MKHDVLAKAYNRGHVRAYGTSALEMENAVRQNRRAQKAKARMQEMSSVFGRSSSQITTVGTGQQVAQVDSTRLNLHQSAPIRESVNQVAGGSITSARQLYDVLVSLDLIQDTPFNKSKFMKVLGVLLPAVREGQIDAYQAAKALKLPEANEYVRVYKSGYTQPSGLSASTKAKISQQQLLQQQVTGLKMQARKAVVGSKQPFLRQAAEIKRQIAAIKADYLASEALRGISVEALGTYVDILLAKTALLTAASYEQPPTQEEMNQAGSSSLSLLDDSRSSGGGSDFVDVTSRGPVTVDPEEEVKDAQVAAAIDNLAQEGFIAKVTKPRNLVLIGVGLVGLYALLKVVR